MPNFDDMDKNEALTLRSLKIIDDTIRNCGMLTDRLCYKDHAERKVQPTTMKDDVANMLEEMGRGYETAKIDSIFK